MYFPQNDKLKIAILDQAVIKAFNRQNHLELSLKTKLTTAQIYNIIRNEISHRLSQKYFVVHLQGLTKDLGSFLTNGTLMVFHFGNMGL